MALNAATVQTKKSEITSSRAGYFRDWKPVAAGRRQYLPAPISMRPKTLVEVFDGGAGPTPTWSLSSTKGAALQLRRIFSAASMHWRPACSADLAVAKGEPCRNCHAQQPGLGRQPTPRLPCLGPLWCR